MAIDSEDTSLILGYTLVIPFMFKADPEVVPRLTWTVVDTQEPSS